MTKHDFKKCLNLSDHFSSSCNVGGDIIPNGKKRMNLQSMKSYVLKSVPSLLRKKTTHESDYCIGFKRTDKHYKKTIFSKTYLERKEKVPAKVRS